jgi:hypothetical protein
MNLDTNENFQFFLIFHIERWKLMIGKNENQFNKKVGHMEK